jgi:hypothetical protein
MLLVGVGHEERGVPDQLHSFVLFHLGRLIFRVEISLVGMASVTEKDGGVREYKCV